MAMLYEDYIKARDMKPGEEVIGSDGQPLERIPYGGIGGYREKPTKNMNLDYYDNHYRFSRYYKAN